jgi:ABC-type amino acid transport substrate-binding protein
MIDRRAVLALGLGAFASHAALAAGKVQTLEPGKLQIGTYFVNPPFEFLEHGRTVGFEVELMDMIARHLGLVPVFIATHWESILDELRGGRYDCIVGAITSPRRARRPSHGRRPT